MEKTVSKQKYKSMQGFAILAISIGVLLAVVASVLGVSIAIALVKGILINTLTDVRINVLRVVFYAIAIIGGLILVIAGRKLLKLDNSITYKNVISSGIKKAVQKKEQMINVFLSSDEKVVMDLIKESHKGVLQSDLVIKTGYSKVKMHRILKNLENKQIIRRGRFGITNKVIANKY
jgi:hypothetical protein